MKSRFITGFQFHKGTIRTKLMLTLAMVMTLFQFHKGTIRTYQQEH